MSTCMMQAWAFLILVKCPVTALILILDIWYLILDIWYLIYDTWYLISDTWYLVLDIWSLLLLAKRLFPFAPVVRLALVFFILDNKNISHHLYNYLIDDFFLWLRWVGKNMRIKEFLWIYRKIQQPDVSPKFGLL